LNEGVLRGLSSRPTQETRGDHILLGTLREVQEREQHRISVASLNQLEEEEKIPGEENKRQIKRLRAHPGVQKDSKRYQGLFIERILSSGRSQK